MLIDMESQIHLLEQEAYGAVLRAFKAQSDALSWEKEGLITELRKELRVSDDEHRDLLTRVNADDVICQIREWRKSGGANNHHLTSPTVSGPRKKQKTSQNMPMSFGIPSQAVTPKWVPSGPGGRRPKLGQPRHNFPGSNTRHPTTVGTPRGQFANQSSDFNNSTNDPLIGRKVMIRWPTDNNFYEAVITNFNEGRHELVYDKDESVELVNLKEIPREDIRWIDEDPIYIRQTGRVVQTNSNAHNFVPNEGRGRGGSSLFDKDIYPLQNGGGATNKSSDDIEILHTDTLIKEVEKVFGSNHPDLFEIEKAKKMLKDHEQALLEVIAKLTDASESESDGREEQDEQMMDGQSMVVLEDRGPPYLQYTRSKENQDEAQQNQDGDEDIIDIE
jgi:hypothetical protein